MLIDTNDKADSVWQILVDEGHSLADAEVGTTSNLWWQTWPGAFDVCWSLTTFGRGVGWLGEDRRFVHFEGLAIGRAKYRDVVAMDRSALTAK